MDRVPIWRYTLKDNLEYLEVRQGSMPLNELARTTEWGDLDQTRQRSLCSSFFAPSLPW